MLPVEYHYLTGLPVKLKNGLGLIYQPKLIDFFNFNLTVEEFAQPFCVRTNSIDLGDDEVITQLLSSLKDFDLFFIDGSQLLIQLKECLKILYKTENVHLNMVEQYLKVDDKFIIDRDSYTYLAKLVLEMLSFQEPKKPDNKRKYKDDYRQQIWEKMQKYRAEKEKKESITTLDMMNTVMHTRNIGYDDILNYTYYQLINSFTTIMAKGNYDEYMMFKSSGQFKLEEDVKHWTITTKIKKGIAL